MIGHCVDCNRDNMKLFMGMYCNNKKMNLGCCDNTEDCALQSHDKRIKN